ncbi:MAG: hypothetical protein IIU58_03215, partial [Clostridia bacterium]|nr:hypothetical protein [Clostridia bacterium]
YCHLGKVMGFAPYGEDAFTRVTVSESFLGTSDAAAGLPFIHAAYGYGKPHAPTPTLTRFDALPTLIKEIL